MPTTTPYNNRLTIESFPNVVNDIHTTSSIRFRLSIDTLFNIGENSSIKIVSFLLNRTDTSKFINSNDEFQSFYLRKIITCILNSLILKIN